MDFLTRIIISAAAAATLSSCFSEFDPKIDSTPVLCMNSNIVEGEPIWLQLTRTWRWDEGDPGSTLDISVDDATVDLYVNGEFKERLTAAVREPSAEFYDPTKGPEKGFEAEYIPQQDDHIRLVATSKKYGEATAETVVPRQVSISKVDVTPLNVTYWGNEDGTTAGAMFDLDIQMHFTDPAESTDYYLFSYGSENTFNGYIYDENDVLVGSYGDYLSINAYSLDSNYEPLFSEHVSVLESVVASNSGYTIFSDRQISGRTYPLHIHMTNIGWNYHSDVGAVDELQCYLVLNLNKISEDYYRHVLSVWVANDGIAGSLGSVGLGEPVFESSNVSTGAGVVSSATGNIVRIDISEIIKARQGA